MSGVLLVAVFMAVAAAAAVVAVRLYRASGPREAGGAGRPAGTADA